MLYGPLAFECPQCGSPEVVYSCNPACCFNHVCGQCYATFEPVTVKIGELEGELGPLLPDPDPTGPTAACARCGECKLLAITEGPRAGSVVCVSCKALLRLELTEVSPA